MTEDWIQRTAARIDEMSSGQKALRLEVHADGDIVLFIEVEGEPVEDKEGNVSSVEFCASGGFSDKTRAALFALIQAIEAEARERPYLIPKYPICVREDMEKRWKV
ncbi:MAG: hypothetical protein RLZZ76_200 [Candidatus Parcubacteria bacterium]|jgi:hypothetical protein